MPTGITTANDIPPAIRDIYMRQMLKDAKQVLVHGLFASTDTIPTRNGDGIEWYSVDDFPEVTTPLTDGVYGAPRLAVRRPISTTLEVYGDHAKLTKRMVNTNLEDVTMNYVTKFGRQWGKTNDTLLRETLNNGLSYLNCKFGTAGTPGTLTNVTTTDLNIFVRQLVTNGAERIASPIKASTLVGTNPVSASYYAYVHSDLRDDIRKMDNFQDASTYPPSKGAYDMELGRVDDVRFLETPNGSYTSGTGVFNILIVAQNSHGMASLAGSKYNIYRHGFGSAGSSDPHSMFMSLGWDAYLASEILNQLWCGSLRCVHS